MPRQPKQNSTDYDSERERVGEAMNAANAAARDIAAGWDAEAPTPEEIDLRERCRLDLRLFLESYFPHCFPLAWSSDHLAVIEAVQRIILEGGMLAIAMPRGSGKTSILERAALWAILYGHHSFVCVVGATEDKGDEITGSMKVELEHNELLRRPFREACYPIRALKGEARRCLGQTFKGERTHIGWGAKRLVLPTMKGSVCSGATVSACGITGSLRGQKVTRKDGVVMRPSLVLVDDPQTRESAMSPAQVAERLAIIRGDVLGLAGPGAKLAAFCAVTVVREGDLADALLDRGRHPEWRGIRTQSVRAWPKAADLWERYSELWADDKRNETATATAFYEANRAAMDEGADVAWPARKEPGELSAIQHQYHLKLGKGDVAYAAEYQNQPIRSDDAAAAMLSVSDVMNKLSAVDRRAVPPAATCLTAFIDVHDTLLFWAVCAWSPRFDGWIVDYGTWPDQPRFTTMRRAQRTIQAASPGAGREGAIRAALDSLAGDLMGRKWEGTDLKVSRCLVDSGFLPDVVSEFCRASPHSAGLMPSRGRHVAPHHKPMEEFSRKPGERLGHKWHIPPPARGRSHRVLVFDTNYWKSYVHGGLATPQGDPGCIALFGRSPQQHHTFAEHIIAEFPVRTSANGRTIDIWHPRPASENHWLDCFVGCAVGASERGIVVPQSGTGATRRSRISLKDKSDAARKATLRSTISLASAQARRASA